MKFSEVINLKLEDLIEWVEAALKDNSKIDKDFHLHSLAEVLAYKARRNEEIDNKIKLAELFYSYRSG